MLENPNPELHTTVLFRRVLRNQASLLVLVVLVYAVAAALLIPASHRFFIEWWPEMLAIATVIEIISLIPPIRRRLEQTTAVAKAGLITFVLIPFLLFLIIGVWFFAASYQVVLLRALFLLIACLLPGTMYYLFIASRKESLFIEFVTNLVRFGLFDQRSGAAIEGRMDLNLLQRLRLSTYVQKFEAVYGPAPIEVLRQLGDLFDQADLARRSPTAIRGYEGIFTPGTAFPLVVATALIALGWTITLPPTFANATEALINYQNTPVEFAFLGAYFFSLQMLFRRYVREDLRASAYVAVSIRIVLAIIGTWVVTAVLEVYASATSQQLLVIGFVIGVFPRVAWQFVQAAVKKITLAPRVLPSLEAQLPLSDLDGLTVWHEARLEEEDIENIPNMATADFVDLLLNTRFPVDRLVDWVDQAILYTHLGPEQDKSARETPRVKLRTHGIRTATDLLQAYRESGRRDGMETLERILFESGSGRTALRTLVDTLSTNPNLKLIHEWRGLSHSDHILAAVLVPASIN